MPYVGREAADKITVMESEKARQAHEELIDIQKRLEALQQLQNKLNMMDGQALRPCQMLAS